MAESDKPQPAERRFSYHAPRPGALGEPPAPPLDMGRPSLAPDACRILVACMPKSGSTFLTTALACLPGMRRVRLYPSPVHRREQELDLLRLLQEEAVNRDLLQDPAGAPAGPRGWVAQHHVRCSRPTRSIIEDYEIVPIVLVRDLADALVSLRDHLRDVSVNMTMAYFMVEMRGWSDEQLQDFLVDMVAPWYIAFFVSWQDCPDRLEVTYERLISDPIACLAEIAERAGLHVSRQQIEAAHTKALGRRIRLNKGARGRGAELTAAQRARLERLAGYYAGVDFSPIGL